MARGSLLAPDMDWLLGDLRYAIRTFLRTPAFTLAAVFMLALGIGASSAMFSVINAVLLRPLPYPDSDRLVSVAQTGSGPFSSGVVGHPTFFAWRRGSRSFSDLAAYTGFQANLVSPAGPEEAAGARVSSAFFAALGARPMLGRAFSASEEGPGGPGIVVLGEGLWRRAFGGDSGVLGQVLRLDGTPYTVIGVMPASFQFPRSAEYWVPLGLAEVAPANGMVRFVNVLGRLKPGVSLAQARADLTTLLRASDLERPPVERGAQATVVSLHEHLYGSGRPALLVLAGAVGFLLLVACANVAGLLLARGAAREREFAIRAALGAGRWRIGRQLIVESVLLAFAGGAAGLLVPAWGIGLFAALAPQAVAATGGIHVDVVVLAATAGCALITGVLFGLAPALAASRMGLADSLKSGAPQSGARHGGLRRVLVAAELAMALVLLAGAGLLTRSFLRFIAIDPGFRPDHVLAVTLHLPGAKYPSAEARAAFFRQLVERAGTLPGVRSTALAAALPLYGFVMLGPVGIGDAAPEVDPSTMAAFNAVTPDYFRTLGVSLVGGRSFSDADVRGAQPVAVINQAFARARFHGSDPIGARLFLRGYAQEHPVIVGVVADVRQVGDNVEATPEVFLPLSQSGDAPNFLALGTVGDPLALAGAVRQAVLRLDPEQPVSEVSDLRQVMEESAAPRRLRAMLLGTFAGVALLLAALGLFGVMAYLVAQRTREIGVRMALGAERGDVLRLVVLEGLRLVGLGMVIGLGSALALTRALGGLLFRVGATDLVTFVAVTLAMGSVALVACYLPARRAARVDPVVALRSE